MATEEPVFALIEKADYIEIRQYRPVIVAETFVEGDMASATRSGFRLIADYIFGNNVSVRASAGTGSEKIAMTAPVSVEPQGNAESASMQAKRWRVQFTMPVGYSVATLPKPRHPAVKVRAVAGKRCAVLMFSGFAGAKKTQDKTVELLAWLKSMKAEPISAPQLARYNPPWTLPFLRRNEILVEIAGG